MSEQAAQRTLGDALGAALSERAGPGQPAGGQDGCRSPSAGVRRRAAWRTAARDPGRLVRELALLGDRRLDPHTLRVEAIERMRGALPIDGYCSSLADPATLCQAWVAGEGVDWSLAPAYYRIELCEPDFAKHVELVRGQSPVRVLSQAARGELERSPRYREVLGPLGMRHELRAAARVDGAAWGFLHLYRSDRRRDFDADDVALVEQLSPVLARALREAALRPCLERPALREPPALLLLDREQRLETTAAGRAQLAGLRDPAAPGEHLPSPLLSLSTRARLLDASGRQGGARATVPGTDGRWYVLDAACTDLGRVAIVSQPVGPEQLLPLILGMYGLTPSERSTSELVLRGLSTKQIAAELVVSPLTVQDRLKGVFAKVGVRSRRELVARLSGAGEQSRN